MVPRARRSVERGADRIEHDHRGTLLAELALHFDSAKLENHLSTASTRGGQGCQEAGRQDIRLINVDMRAPGHCRAITTAAQPKHNGLSLWCLGVPEYVELSVIELKRLAADPTRDPDVCQPTGKGEECVPVLAYREKATKALERIGEFEDAVKRCKYP